MIHLGALFVHMLPFWKPQFILRSQTHMIDYLTTATSPAHIHMNTESYFLFPCPPADLVKSQIPETDNRLNEEIQENVKNEFWASKDLYCLAECLNTCVRHGHLHLLI